MSRVSRTVGMLRSLAIYHAIPLRQRRLRRFYSQFVSRGDLVFDLGAHAGNRTRAFAAMGCRVVAVEPQPDFARLLRLLMARSPNVDVIEAAVGEKGGRGSLLISERTPTVTTIAAAWHASRSREPDFAHVKWNRQIDVETTTLDLLIERFGTPDFVKLDVEGAEPSVLAGLRRPVPALSFEYLPRALDYAHLCVERLSALGVYRYNWSPGESYRLAGAPWMTGAELRRALESAAAQRRPGDVYALLDAS
ncbi:MAG: FkbM family methyltransferase [Acidobacteria bacterium]|nr:MAG: FkbM family methyltransferase [Acidobacteriota bacterium]